MRTDNVASGDFGFRGVMASLAGQWGRVAVQLAALVILSRVLSPSDYGLMAIVAGVVNVANVFSDGGLSGASLQAKSLSHSQRSNLLWTNVALGVILCIVMVVVARPISRIYGNTELALLFLMMSPVFIVNGFSAQYRISLNRAGKFLSMSVADVVGAIIGLATGIICAVRGFGAMALVFQQLSTSLATCIILVAACPWLPSLPKRGQGTVAFFRFGGMWLATMIASSVANSVSPLALGWYQVPSVVGSYNRALQIAQQPINQLLGPLTRLAVPKAVQAGDDMRVRSQALYTIHSPMAMVTSAVLSLLVAASSLAGKVLLGDQWSSIGLIVAILAIGSIIQTGQQISYWLLFSSGNSKLLFLSEIVPRCVFIVGVIACARFGVVVVCIAIVVLQTMILLVGCIFALPIIGVSVREALNRSLKPVTYFLILSITILVGKIVLEIGCGVNSAIVDWLAVGFWILVVGVSSSTSRSLRHLWISNLTPLSRRLMPWRAHRSIS